MLKRLIAFSLNNAPLVIVLAGLVVGLAVFETTRMPVDVFPELNAPTVVVLTEAGGYSAEEVEQYVTLPLESGLNGLPGVRRVRSGSALGLSLVWVEFEWGQDIYRARQVVGEGLSSVREQLPDSVHTEIAPITGITGEIMLLSLSNDSDENTPQVTDLELRTFAEFDLRQRLLAVPGVAQVVAIGGKLPEYQVNVKQEMLRSYELSMDDVVQAATEAHSNASAGYLPNVKGTEIALRQTARIKSADDINRTIIKYHDGIPVTIGQVAEVKLGPAISRGAGGAAFPPEDPEAPGAQVHASNAVVIGVKKAPFTNTLKITEDIDIVLDGIESALPSGMKLDRNVMRQSDFINVSLDNLIIVLRDAAIFVTVVLIMFLLNVRITVITLTAIPLSIAFALLFMSGMNMSINVMTLGGLAIAIGELVDDAIIDVENVYRRLRENQALPQDNRRPRMQVIFDASNEIRSSVVFATIIIVVVFLPLLFLQGVEGRFFRPMGMAFIVSIIASLIVALTVVPAMCKYLIRGKLGKSGKAHQDPFLVRMLKKVYEPALKLAIKLRILVVIVALVMTGASLWLASTYGKDFLPDFNEGTFTIFIDAPPGTALEESDRMVRGLDRRLAGLEGVRAVVRRTGRAERDEHAHGVNRSEIEVSIKEGVNKQDVKTRIDKVLADMPKGVKTEVGAPIGHRLSHILSGTQAAIAINVFGQDLAQLREIAKQVEAELQTIPGARDVLANRGAQIESLPIRYRHDDLARWGLTPASAASQVEAAFNGVTVNTVNDGIRLYEVVVRLTPEERENADDVKDLLLRSRGGQLVRLSEVASIGPEYTPLGIQHENSQRKAVISLNVADGYNLGHVVEAVKAKVDPIVKPYGYAVTYGGQFEAQQSASQTLYITGAFVFIVILVLLSVSFGSVRAGLLVMINLPLATIGGVVAIFITKSDDIIANASALMGNGIYQAPVISIASMVGFVTLFGIAVRNGLLLVNHYAHLMRYEGKSFEEAIIQGSLERLSPILMTALTAVLGLLPLAMAGGQPGSELLAPLAVVVLGGLVTSTFLNLIVVPAGYYLVFRKHPIDYASQKIDLGSIEQPN